MELFAWDYEGLMTQDEAQSLLVPHADKFGCCLTGAWEEWRGVSPLTRPKISSMQRGGFVHDLIIDRAKEMFAPDQDGNPDPQICTEGFFKIYVGDKIVVRFKKLQADRSVPLSWAKYCTRTYYNGGPLAEVRPDVQRMTVGYVLDESGEDIEDVLATLQIRDEVVWSFSLLSPPVILAAPPPSVTPPGEAQILPIDDSNSQQLGGAG